MLMPLKLVTCGHAWKGEPGVLQLLSVISRSRLGYLGFLLQVAYSVSFHFTPDTYRNSNFGQSLQYQDKTVRAITSNSWHQRADFFFFFFFRMTVVFPLMVGVGSLRPRPGKGVKAPTA
ncbi:hypothetical protein EV356DRAFT_176929 [Viridothelium virens]|uniref:Uncharacterized protein n=1 Tax=Viridothelium virens TaxID=1048519 RepID=A0A6A6H8K5_VIRVR|nr:hypothetical protein EV356DRAFT_176929 [Viridothelium virens]